MKPQLIPIYHTCYLQQTAALSQCLYPAFKSNIYCPTFIIQTQGIGEQGIATSFPSMLISRDNAKSGTVAIVNFKNNGYSTELWYPKGEGIQQLVLRSISKRRYHVMIDDRPCSWKPGDMDGVLELIDVTSRDIVATFTYEATSSSKAVSVGDRVGTLRVCQELGERMVPFEQVICTLIAMVEREKRRRQQRLDGKNMWP